MRTCPFTRERFTIVLGRLNLHPYPLKWQMVAYRMCTCAYRVHVLPSLETRSIENVTEIRTHFQRGNSIFSCPRRLSRLSFCDFYIYFPSELHSSNLDQKTARCDSINTAQNEKLYLSRVISIDGLYILNTLVRLSLFAYTFSINFLCILQHPCIALVNTYKAGRSTKMPYKSASFNEK